MSRPELSLVIPIYNEEEVLPQLDLRLKELLKTLAIDAEVVFVNDGSKDKSMELLRRMASRELRYRVIGFSRNFGHQRAITAGMEKSRGRAVVVMDADLQDPPEVILEMVAKWREGYDVVYGRRRSREGESAFKLVTAKLFYRVFATLIPIEVPLDTGDFRLMSRRVVTTMRGLRESHRFVRGLVAWVGFKQTAVEYDRAARAAGETKYPLKKMIAFAIDGIASFSIQPLRFATYTGVFVGTASVLYAVASMITWFAGMNVPGWTTTVVLVSFLFSVQFFMIGVLGEYVGRIYEQVKRRPLYIVAERINFGRRRVEKLVTSDLEELPATALTETAHDVEPAGASSVPPPPAAILAAGAAAEASLSKTPPPVKAGRSPAAPGVAGGSTSTKAGTPTKPGTPSVSPMKAASASPTSVPPTKAASVASPKATPSVPPTRAPSAPPAPTPSVPPARTASIPPPKPTPSVPPTKAAPPTGASSPSIPPAKAASIPPPKASPSVPPRPASIPPPDVSPSVPPAKAASIPPPKTSASVPPRPASIPPRPAGEAASPERPAGLAPESASGEAVPDAATPPSRRDARSLFGAPKADAAKSAAPAGAEAPGGENAPAATAGPAAKSPPPASSDHAVTRGPSGEDDDAKGRTD
ncbi:MAG: glycosyltransferase [Labilithrix sp.]|nr:glycosyltransferase [Labilithrix sp.]